MPMDWRLRLVALLGLAIASVATEGMGQTAKQFFLERPPSKAELAALPSNLDAVAIAKVRIVEGAAWVGGRDQSGKPPPPPKALGWARVEILDVLSGPTEISEMQDVLFASGANGTPTNLNARTLSILSFPASKPVAFVG
jgi:hypothetical protein